MLAAAPGVYRLFMEGGDNVPYVWPYKLPNPKLDKVLGARPTINS